MTHNCVKCGTNLSNDNWYKFNRKKYYNICNDCMKEKNSKWKENNPDKVKVSRRKYYWNHREQELIYSKKWATEHPDKAYEKTKRYNQTEHGKNKLRERNARRYRALNYIVLIENSFPKEVLVDYHHINNLLVVPVPRTIHRNNSFPDREKHRIRCK